MYNNQLKQDKLAYDARENERLAYEASIKSTKNDQLKKQIELQDQEAQRLKAYNAQRVQEQQSDSVNVEKVLQQFHNEKSERDRKYEEKHEYSCRFCTLK